MRESSTSLVRVDANLYGEKFHDHILAQYKMFAETADRVSARRALANSFFLAANSTLIVVFFFIAKDHIALASLVLPILLAVAIGICYIWWRVLASYRQLNAVKFRMLQQLERHLPAALYEHEWEQLGCGEVRKKYWPLTGIENWAPVYFTLLYVFLFAAISLAS